MKLKRMEVFLTTICLATMNNKDSNEKKAKQKSGVNLDA
jgi:hypothetical protein